MSTLHTVYDAASEGAEALNVPIGKSSYGEPLAKAPPPLERSFRKQTQEEGFTFASYEYANDERDMRYNISILTDEGRLYRRDDPALVEVEDDNATKANTQRGHKACWYIPESPFGAGSDKRFSEDVVDAVREYFLGRADAVITMSEAVTRHTNGGYPTFVSGASPYSDLNLLVNTTIAGNVQLTAEEIFDVIQDELARIGYPMPPCFTLFSRTRHAKKMQRDWHLTAAGAHSSSKSRGHSCPMRMVQGGIGWVNARGRKAAIALKKKLYSIPSFHVMPEQYTLNEFYHLHVAGLSGFSEDISGFDLSVSSAMMEQVRSIYLPLLKRYHFLDTFDSHINWPILGPPADDVNQAYLYNKNGLISSGTITTDIDGTIINFLRIVQSIMASQGWTAKQAITKLEQREWYVKVKGDDTVLFAPKTFNREVYLAATTDLGFKTDLLPGIVFLMTRYDLDRRTYYGLASRAFMQTAFREHEPAGKFTEIFGMYARAIRLVRHPSVDLFQKALFEHPSAPELFAAYSVPTTLSDLERVVLSPGFIEGFQQEVKSTRGRMWMRMFISGITRGTMDMGEAVTDARAAALLGIREVKDLSFIPPQINIGANQLRRLIRAWLSFFYVEMTDQTGATLPREEILKNSSSLRVLLNEFKFKNFLDDELNISLNANSNLQNIRG